MSMKHSIFVILRVLNYLILSFEVLFIYSSITHAYTEQIFIERIVIGRALYKTNKKKISSFMKLTV